jgi:hypothetical protein
MLGHLAIGAQLIAGAAEDVPAERRLPPRGSPHPRQGLISRRLRLEFHPAGSTAQVQVAAWSGSPPSGQADGAVASRSAQGLRECAVRQVRPTCQAPGLPTAESGYLEGWRRHQVAAWVCGSSPKEQGGKRGTRCHLVRPRRPSNYGHLALADRPRDAPATTNSQHHQSLDRQEDRSIQ